MMIGFMGAQNINFNTSIVDHTNFNSYKQKRRNDNCMDSIDSSRRFAISLKVDKKTVEWDLGHFDNMVFVDLIIYF